jgi:hypothetical protein
MLAADSAGVSDIDRSNVDFKGGPESAFFQKATELRVHCAIEINQLQVLSRIRIAQILDCFAGYNGLTPISEAPNRLTFSDTCIRYMYS